MTTPIIVPGEHAERFARRGVLMVDPVYRNQNLSGRQ